MASFIQRKNFLANLNDGELCRSSDYFPAEPHFRPNNNNLNFFDHRRQILNSKLPLTPKGLEFSGGRQYPSQNGYYGVNMGPTVDHGLLRNPNFVVSHLTNPVPPRHPLCYPIHYPHPQGTKVQLMDNRIGGSNRRVHVHEPPTRNQNRVPPFQQKTLDLGFRFGNRFMKEAHGIGAKAGTGVFIPRAPSNHKTTTSDPARKNLKQGVTAERGGGRKVKEGTDKTEEKHCYNSQLNSSSEIRLPNEWTY